MNHNFNMELTLNLEEVSELLAHLREQKISLLTLRLKTNEIENILSVARKVSLSPHLCLSLNKALPHECLPTQVEDVNLVLLSYLDDIEITKLSLVNKKMRAIATRQDIWRERIKKRRTIDVGQESPVFNLGFYWELEMHPGLELIPAIRGGSQFIPFFDQMWPTGDLYRILINNDTFIEQIKNAVKKEDRDLLFALIE